MFNNKKIKVLENDVDTISRRINDLELKFTSRINFLEKENQELCERLFGKKSMASRLDEVLRGYYLGVPANPETGELIKIHNKIDKILEYSNLEIKKEPSKPETWKVVKKENRRSKCSSNLKRK